MPKRQRKYGYKPKLCLIEQGAFQNFPARLKSCTLVEECPLTCGLRIRINLLQP